MAYMTDVKSAAELLFEKKHQLFLNFCAHTTQTKNSIMYMRDKLDTLAKSLATKSIFNYLDIGCGFGDKTLSMINAIKQYHRINAVALDPSERLLSLFKEALHGQDLDIVCTTWEEYQSDTNFNFISSIHTFYYINNWEYAILKMMACLDRNGEICVALRSTDAVCQFRDFIYEIIHNDGRKERNCEELCELLDNLNIKYKIDYVDSVLDINDCLLNNEKGKQLLEFILRQPYDNLFDINHEIISYLTKVQRNGYVTQRDGYIWIYNK